jgi:hypothetical protein
MRFRYFLAYAAVVGLVVGALYARTPAVNANLLLGGTSGGGGGGCAQATTFLARATGMDSTHNTAFTTMICGLVTDGVITGSMAGSVISGATACGSPLDVFYIFATDTSGHALLNLCSTGFTATNTNSLAFTADSGFLGSASHVIDSTDAVSSSGGNYALNSAGMGNYSLTATTSAKYSMANKDAVGGGSGSYLLDYDTGDNSTYCDMNAFSAQSGRIVVAVGGGKGFFICNRSGSSAIQAYLNGVSIATGTSASTAIASGINMGVNGAIGIGQDDSGITIGAAFVGGSISSGNALALYNRVCAYLHTVNATAVPSC